MTARTNNLLRPLFIIIVIGAAAYYLYGFKAVEHTTQATPVAANTSNDDSQPVTAIQAAADDVPTASRAAAPALTPAPWMQDAARGASPPESRENAFPTPSAPVPPSARAAPNPGALGNALDATATLAEARRSLQTLRETQGSDIAGPIRLDVLEKNLDIVERMNTVAHELQRLQQANSDLDPNSPELQQHIKTLNDLSGKLNLNFTVDGQLPPIKAPKK